MERILSKNEISDLLAAVKEGEVGTQEGVGPGRGGRSATRLDLVQVPGAGRWRLPNLDIVFDLFGRNGAISLTNRLQRSVTAKLEALDSMEFDEFLQGVPAHSAMGLLRLDPLKTGGLMMLDGPLAFVLVEVLLGGATEGRPVKLDRALTAIEINLIRSVMEDLCGDLQKAFQGIEKIEPALLRIENNPRMVNIVPADSGVMVARLAVNVDQLSGQLVLVIPHASLEPLRDRLRDGFHSPVQSQAGAWQQRLSREAEMIETTLCARIGEVRLKVRDILNFQVGDIIDLGCGPNAPLQVLVEGKPKFADMAGVRNGSKAVRIVRKQTSGDNDEQL